MDPIAVYETFLSAIGHEMATALAVIFALATVMRERRMKGQRDSARAERDAAETEADARALEADALRASEYELRRENLDLRGGLVVPQGADAAVLFGKEVAE